MFRDDLTELLSDIQLESKKEPRSKVTKGMPEQPVSGKEYPVRGFAALNRGGPPPVTTRRPHRPKNVANKRSHHSLILGMDALAAVGVREDSRPVDAALKRMVDALTLDRAAGSQALLKTVLGFNSGVFEEYLDSSVENGTSHKQTLHDYLCNICSALTARGHPDATRAEYLAECIMDRYRALVTCEKERKKSVKAVRNKVIHV